MKIELPVTELINLECSCGNILMAIDLKIGDITRHGGRR
jgi:hypothetical protein